MALLLLTYEYEFDGEGYDIRCLDTDEIYTCCYEKNEIEKFAAEATQLMLPDLPNLAEKVKLKAHLAENQFQLLFDSETFDQVQIKRSEAA